MIDNTFVLILSLYNLQVFDTVVGVKSEHTQEVLPQYNSNLIFNYSVI